jgi:hypothetical protein
MIIGIEVGSSTRSLPGLPAGLAATPIPLFMMEKLVYE